ncbi:hypothetical protein MASR2M66_08940 [Chloroflexota bacterium]
MRKYSLLFPFAIVLLALACALPSAATPETLSTFDPNSMQTVIVETGVAAQTQTAVHLPTLTQTVTPTRTPFPTPTVAPTFLFSLPTFTPIPSITPFPSATFTGVPKDENEDGEPPQKPKRDPLAMTGKEWSCSVLGTFPPQKTEFKQKTKFTVQWEVFNSGTKFWPYFGLDIVYKGGYRHEETKIQDFARSVPSGGRILLSASFITPKAAGEYNSYFTLMVGRKIFCQMMYTFVVGDK